MNWEDIPGWFDFEGIYDDAVKRARPGEIIVEVGAWYGKSSCYLGAKCKERGDGVAALCVDTWRGTPGTQLEGWAATFPNGDVLPYWQQNVRACGVENQVAAMRMPSLEAAKELKDARFPCVFLDGDHSLEAVRAEVRAWWPRVREGGMLAGHDYDRPETVKRAVIERFGSRVEAVAPRSWKVEKPCLANQTMPESGLCAAVNLGNDAWTLDRLLDSVESNVRGVVLINTQEGKFEALKRDFPIWWHSMPWHDYAYNQTWLLEKARQDGFKWALVLDADEELVAPHGLGVLDPEIDAYDVCRIYSADYEVWTPRLFNLRRAWQYEGARHAHPTMASKTRRLENVEVIHWGDDEASFASKEEKCAKFYRDVEHFQKEVARTDLTRRQYARAYYYLGQSAADAYRNGAIGMRDVALDAFAHRLANHDGFQEERYIAALQLARMNADLSFYWTAIDLRPHRFEARVELAQALMRAKVYERAIEVLTPCEAMGPSGDSFLVRRSDEQWRWAEVMQLAKAHVEAKK